MKGYSTYTYLNNVRTLKGPGKSSPVYTCEVSCCVGCKRRRWHRGGSPPVGLQSPHHCSHRHWGRAREPEPSRSGRSDPGLAPPVTPPGQNGSGRETGQAQGWLVRYWTSLWQTRRGMPCVQKQECHVYTRTQGVHWEHLFSNPWQIFKTQNILCCMEWTALTLFMLHVKTSVVVYWTLSYPLSFFLCAGFLGCFVSCFNYIKVFGKDKHTTNKDKYKTKRKATTLNWTLNQPKPLKFHCFPKENLWLEDICLGKKKKKKLTRGLPNSFWSKKCYGFWMFPREIRWSDTQQKCDVSWKAFETLKIINLNSWNDLGKGAISQTSGVLAKLAPHIMSNQFSLPGG